ncbi:hypothetical protein GWK47_052305 [Chionoecetes opilio]|uniref:Uncharacterized protein n=1 Tax=Chionoecetes opilio TaxID=41210 RepID=A0A8J5CRV6_CHIOP|nr:hypothetical protein GWK47_052305 [Chionoecetes opilio]
MTFFDIGHGDAFAPHHGGGDRIFLRGQRSPDGPLHHARSRPIPWPKRATALERGVLKRRAHRSVPTTASALMGLGCRRKRERGVRRTGRGPLSRGRNIRQSAVPQASPHPIMTPVCRRCVGRTGSRTDRSSSFHRCPRPRAHSRSHTVRRHQGGAREKMAKG